MAKRSNLKILGVAAVAALALAAVPAVVSAQGGFASGFASPEAMDTLNSGSVGGGGAGQLALQRAQGVAGVNQQGGGGGFDSADPFGGGGGGFGGDEGTVTFSDTGEFSGASGGAIIDPNTGQSFSGVASAVGIQVIAGERVICHVTGEMLQDARKTKVNPMYKDSYYDDGVRGMDARADDQIFTKVTLVNNVMSPEAHLVQTRYIRALQVAENLPPNEFFNVIAATTEPLSEVPKMIDLEADRDDKLGVWSSRFLRDFRVNPDQEGDWEFYQTFMPPPPRTPLLPIPANFVPPGSQRAGEEEGTTDEQGGGVRGAVAARFGADEIQSNAGASSSYFGGMGQ
ncbi:hypothetical protein KQI84_12710 [bacterium]|nr:hypothetical protein [bacterium]